MNGRKQKQNSARGGKKKTEARELLKITYTKNPYNFTGSQKILSNSGRQTDISYKDQVTREDKDRA